MQESIGKPDYRGKRALILTRVSTPQQQEKYGHAAQERQVRDKLIDPLELRIVHTIHDTYTGLEYRYREALECILGMAERKEFDVLCMDVLDRGLGRKALAREMFRMQLRELGIRILTTEPSDHADDDSLEGQIMRFIKGYKAEEEINDLVRRTTNGKREKALGDSEKGIPSKLVGCGTRLYGYQFVYDEKGVRIGYERNFSIVHIEEDGTEWTEGDVVVFIFTSAAEGVSTRQICRIINAKGIPSPFVTKGMTSNRVKEPPSWQPQVISRMLKNSSYYGECRQFTTASIGRVPGYKRPARRNTSEEEQVIVNIPAIVTKELAEKAQQRVSSNKQLATRNNQTSRDSLVRGGFAKCGYCGTTLRIFRRCNTRKNGTEVAYFSYNCAKPYSSVGACSGCSISVDILDTAVWEKAVEIIRDPSEVDRKIEQLTAENSATQQRKRALKTLNDIRREQETLRNNLSAAMRKKILDEKTVAFLSRQLHMLEQQEQEVQTQLANEQALQEKYNKLDQRIAEFHQQCTQWREQLDNSEFIPSFMFKRDAIQFFGISVTVWKQGADPRYVINLSPPNIVELLS